MPSWKAAIGFATKKKAREPSNLEIAPDAEPLSCKIWYSISQTVSDLGSIYDRSIRAFAVKPHAFGAPLSSFGA